MPQVGEKRTVGGETREWTGSRWTGVSAPESNMPLDTLLARADALSAGGGGTEKTYDPVQKLIGPQNIPAGVRDLKDPDAGSNHKTYFQEHPNVPIQETTNPLAAMLGSGAQTAGRVAKGAAMAVPNAITSLPDLPMQVVKGYGGLTELAHNPSLLMEAPGALKEGFDYIGENPEAGGELLAQIALGKVAPAATEGAMRLGSAGLEAARSGLGKAGRITTGVAKALAPEFLSKRMNTIGQVFNEVRKGGNEAAPRPTADWSADASARPEWDPAGPSKRAAGQAGRAGANTPEGAGSNITMNDLIDEGRPEITSYPVTPAEPIFNQFVPRTPEEMSSLGPNVSVHRSPADLLENTQRGVEAFGQGQVRPLGANVDVHRSLADLIEQTQRGAEVDPTMYQGKPSAPVSKGPAFSHSSFLDSLRKSLGEPSLAPVEPELPVSPFAPARREVVRNFVETELPGKDRTHGFTGRNEFGMGGLAHNRPHPLPRPQNPTFLDFAEEAPLTDMERLAARSAERFGRRYRPEF